MGRDNVTTVVATYLHRTVPVTVATNLGDPIMTATRRSFLGAAAGAAAAATASRESFLARDDRGDLLRRIDEAAAAPVLRVDGLEKPVKIASMELLRNRRNFVVQGADLGWSRGDRRCPTRCTWSTCIRSFPEPGRTLLRRQGRPAARGSALGALSPRRQLQVSRARSLGLPGGGRVRHPGFARQAIGPVGRRPAGRGPQARHRGLPGQRGPRESARGGNPPI